MVAAAAILMVIGSGAGPAAADSRNTTVGPGDSYQTQVWVREDGGKVRLINRTDGIGSGRCIDTIIDWDTNGSGHYDSRILRNCKPNGIIDTDPGGDGYWQEGWGTGNCCPPYTGPPLWGQTYARVIVGVQRGGAYKIDDGTLNPVDPGDRQMWTGGPPSPRRPPRTLADPTSGRCTRPASRTPPRLIATTGAKPTRRATEGEPRQ